MAWSYNPKFGHFFRIGLVARSPRQHGPAATVVHKSGVFLGNSQIPKIPRPSKRQKSHFSMACFTRPIFAILPVEKSQFDRRGLS
jgi:hypothetical protein